MEVAPAPLVIYGACTLVLPLDTHLLQFKSQLVQTTAGRQQMSVMELIYKQTNNIVVANNMAISPILSPLTLPAGTEWPGTPQLGLNLFCQYAKITGLLELGGINFGPTTPASDLRDRPWFKTDVSGNPIGWVS